MFKSSYQFFKKKYLATIDPDGSKLLTAIKCTFIGSLIFVVTYYITVPQSIFLALSAVLFMIVAPTELPQKNLLSMSICAAVTMVGCFLVTLAAHSTWQLSLALFIMAFLAIYLNKYKKLSNFTGIIALMIVVLAAGLGGNFTIAIERVINIMVALVIAIIFNFLVWPYYTFKKTKHRLAVIFDKMAEYFFHTIADSLRGNHLILKHHQKKNEILILATNNQSAIVALASKYKKYLILKDIENQQEYLLKVFFALANLFNQPIFYSATVYFFPDIKNFCLITNQIYHNYANCLRGKQMQEINLQKFEEVVKEIGDKLMESMTTIMQANIIYQWPFDLSNFIYLLAILNHKTQLLDKKLKELC